MKTSIPKSKRPLPQSKHTGLRVKPEKPNAWDRLPFVGKDHSKQCSSWDVPLTGGYFGGIDAGKSIAHMFFKYLRDEQANPVRLGSTHFRMMISALDSKVPATKEEEESLKGQRVGFMCEVADWLDAAVLKLGSSLDAIPERSLVQQANQNLARADAAFMAAIDAASRKKKVECAAAARQRKAEIAQ